MNIKFEKANASHQDIIFQWLAEPHIQEFWDNSQEHKDDIVNFINGNKQNYFYGTTLYWIGTIGDEPYCFVLSDIIEPEQEISDVHREYLSTSGRTIVLDFGIGNKDYLGKGLAASTLEQFVAFYHKYIDPTADTFLIDPDDNNPRAQHVYNKAGFNMVGEYIPTAGAFVGKTSHVMVKHVDLR